MSEKKEAALTGVNKRTREKILRMMSALAGELDANGLVLFSGGCTDSAVLVHRETGIVLGLDQTGVWLGGDFNAATHEGLQYCPDISPTAGKFAQATK